MDSVYDLIIIGGGAAGLNAATHLKKRKKVLLLEARDRLGGRIFTRHLQNWTLPVEMGPEFVHGDRGPSIKILGKKNIYAVEDNHLFYADGKLQDMNNFWEDVEKVFQKLKPTKKDRSFSQFLKAHDFPKPAEEITFQYVEGFHAANAKKISANALSQMNPDEANFRLKVGYDTLIRNITPSDLDYRLKTEVTEIHWKKNDVVVKTNRFVFHAKKVLITLPLGVLKKNQVKFFPALPKDKQKAIKQLEMGMVAKVVFLFKKKLWPSTSFIHRRLQEFPTWWTTLPKKSNVLVGWMGGPAVEKLVGLSPDAVAEAALTKLSELIQVPYLVLNENLVDFAYHDWQSDPHSRGAYSYIGVGGEKAPSLLAKPVANTIFFAGEATYEKESGTVNGALESGREAAKLIAKSLRR